MPGEQSRINGRKNKNQGRPKASSTLIAQEFRRQLAEEINKDMQSWIEPMKDVAKGHFIQVTTKDGEVKVYKKAPDPNAWQKVMDRAFGKPKETVEVQDTASEEAMEKIDATREDVRELAKRFDDELKAKLMK
jgi:hypothetical protein